MEKYLEQNLYEQKNDIDPSEIRRNLIFHAPSVEIAANANGCISEFEWNIFVSLVAVSGIIVQCYRFTLYLLSIYTYAYSMLTVRRDLCVCV